MQDSEWLISRDSRTNAAIGNNNSDYRNHAVTVRINSELATLYEGQVMLLIAVNILASWCDNVQVVCPEVESALPQINKNFLDVLHKTYTIANSVGSFSINKKSYYPTVTELFIGKDEGSLSNDSVEKIWIDGSGWLAGFGRGKKETASEYGRNNPLGPAFAACLGVSEVFRVAIDSSSKESFSRWYSLYDFNDGAGVFGLANPDFDQTLDLGTLYQLGCGAIGSSFVYLLKLTNWSGQIHLLDHDTIEPHNLSASLLFNTEHLKEVTAKVDVCTEVLADTGFVSTAYEMDYDQFVSNGYLEKFPADLILCFANERNIWSTIQQNYPPLVMHATTTKSWGINFGRHIPTEEWCIMCRFQNEIDSNYTPVCGQSLIKGPAQEKEILASLPFLSPASSIIVLAELAKLRDNNYPVNNNFVEFSFRAGQNGIFIPSLKKPQPCYVCGSQNPDLHKELIGKTKFYNAHI